MGSLDLIISGHRAVDGETGQTGPQTAWKMGFNFFGNVIGYEIDAERRMLYASRLVELQGLYTVIEEVECPLPAFIAVDPSYRERYTTVSQRLKYTRLQKDAVKRAQDYKRHLKVWSAKDLGLDAKYVGLPGSPTIVYRVERIPKAKASRKTRAVDSNDAEELAELGKRLLEVVNGKVPA
jgi:electron transfer flavoprotein beta subunit